MRDERHQRDTDREQLELLFAEAMAPETHSPRRGEGMVPPEAVENPMREEEDLDLSLETVATQVAEPERPDLTALVNELGAGLGSTISGLFRRMELAEDEIEAAKRRDPENAERIHGAFKYLLPTESLQRKADPLYRAHCRELISRVAAGAGEKEISLGTSAEVLATLADLSCAAPLERTAFLLYGKLFTQVFPEKAAEIEPLRGPVDGWETEEALALEARFRRKLATERSPS